MANRASFVLPFVALLFACRGDQPAATPHAPATADAHTHDAVAKMDAAVAAAKLDAASTDVAAFRRLGAVLRAEIDALIAGCTMTGPDHDRLHGWLGEMLPAADGLLDGPDLAAVRDAHRRVVAALASFRVQFAASKPRQ